MSRTQHALHVAREALRFRESTLRAETLLCRIYRDSANKARATVDLLRWESHLPDGHPRVDGWTETEVEAFLVELINGHES